MSVFLHPLALILQRALTTLGLRLGRAFRRRPRQLPVHLETQAGGSPSELVSTRCPEQVYTRAVINALLQAVVRQSEPPTPTLGRSIAAFCTAGAAERLSAADHNENCREHDFLQAPELVSTILLLILADKL